MNLADLIHRIATDEQFAAQFIDDPNDAIRTSGLTLDSESLQALTGILRKSGSLSSLLNRSGIAPDDPVNWAFHSLKVATSSEQAP